MLLPRALYNEDREGANHVDKRFKNNSIGYIKIKQQTDPRSEQETEAVFSSLGDLSKGGTWLCVSISFRWQSATTIYLR